MDRTGLRRPGVQDGGEGDRDSLVGMNQPHATFPQKGAADYVAVHAATVLSWRRLHNTNEITKSISN
jgi:hypothetical protein